MQQTGDCAVRFRWLPAAFLAAVSIAVAVESWRLGLGDASQPGPGFFPFWLSVALAASAAALATGVGRLAGVQPGAEGIGGIPLSLRVFIVLCVYCALLIPAGYIAATLFFFAVEARLIENVSWPRAALYGAIATAVSYGMFILLDVQLPAGLWLE
jgi:putative tricarboxylic transport membrane protein